MMQFEGTVLNEHDGHGVVDRGCTEQPYLRIYEDNTVRLGVMEIPRTVVQSPISAHDISRHQRLRLAWLRSSNK